MFKRVNVITCIKKNKKKNDKKLSLEWLLVMSENFTYDATFSDNILVVG